MALTPMAIKAKTGFSLKDQLFNARSVSVLSDALAKSINVRQGKFNQKQFEKEVLDKFPALELKQRIDWMVIVLARYLPENFDQALNILEDLLPPPLDPEKTDNDFGQFIWTIPGEYVAKFGCTESNLNKSLTFLGESTKRFTAENPIRPFLRQYPTESMSFIRKCALNKNYHVRRLASEGIRPFLPWAARANVNHDEIFEVLELLKHDNTRYVIRSVANTLNDLSKIEPDKVIATLTKWQKKPSSDTQWLTRHALRTLVKQDHPDALALLGYPIKPEFKVSAISIPDSVQVGENLVYTCKIKSQANQNLKIALRIHYLKANARHSPRVFAVKDVKARSGDVLQVSKKISFRPITTRAMYRGEHHVEIVVNGVARGKRSFLLQ